MFPLARMIIAEAIAKLEAESGSATNAEEQMKLHQKIFTLTKNMSKYDKYFPINDAYLQLGDSLPEGGNYNSLPPKKMESVYPPYTFKRGDVVTPGSVGKCMEKRILMSGEVYIVAHPYFALVLPEHYNRTKDEWSEKDYWIANGINCKDFRLFDPIVIQQQNYANQCEKRNPIPTSSPSLFMSVLSAARNLLLSDAEKKFRKSGMKDCNGIWSMDTMNAFIMNLMDEAVKTDPNFLTTLANSIIAEQEKKCS